MKRFELASDVYSRDLSFGIAALAVLITLRLTSPFLLNISLFYDEAQYYYWSLTPDWGYFSKPPMVAWIIGLTSELAVEEWAVRLGSPILYGGAAVIVWRLARHWLSETQSVWSGVIFISLPLVGFNSMFITTDAPLLFFWALALWAFTKALQSRKVRFWLMVGVACGLGLLSKYTMGLFLICALAFAFRPGYRWIFTHPGPYLGAMLAFLIVLPNLWWNEQHNFISFQHTLEISQLGRTSWSFEDLIEFCLSQLLCLGPWLLILLRSHVGQDFPASAEHNSDCVGFVCSFTLPVIVTFALLALTSRANANWAAPVYVALPIYLASKVVTQRHWKLLRFGVLANLMVILGLQLYHPLASVIGFDLNSRSDPYKRVSGWQPLMQRLTPILEADPSAIVVSNSRELLSQAAYYARDGLAPKASNLVAWNPTDRIDNHYQLVTRLEPSESSPILFFSSEKLPLATLQKFAPASEPIEISVPVYVDFSRKLFVYKFDAFLGY